MFPDIDWTSTTCEILLSHLFKAPPVRTTNFLRQNDQLPLVFLIRNFSLSHVRQNITLFLAKKPKRRLPGKVRRLNMKYHTFANQKYKMAANCGREGTSDFRLRTSDFGLQTSDFGLQTSDFRLQTSDFRFWDLEFRLLTSDSGLP